MPRQTYLDHNATTPVRPEVAAAIAAALELGGNPSSVHGSGRAARQAIEAARREVAALVGAGESEIVFVSGGSEANHLALKGSGRARLIVSAVEHDSVLRVRDDAEIVAVDGNGLVNPAALAALLTRDPRPALVSIMLANNETGAIQPIAALSAVAHAQGALVHCDAIQGAGKLPLDRQALGADLLSLSAHKIGGPPGTGALVVAPGIALEPLQRGGGQERGLRAGTENLPGIVGFGRAAALAAADLPAYAELALLRDEAACRLRAIAPDAVVFAEAVPRLPNTLAIAMPGVPSETQVMALDLDGIMVSAGAACSSGKVRASHVLAAMGFDATLAGSAIRVSLGRDTHAADIDHLTEAWGALYRRTRERRANAA